MRISGLILKAKAEEFAEKLGRSDFIATEGWLSRWKGRYQTKCKHAHGEKVSADFGGAEVWKSTKLLELLSEYNPCDIYNADETALYYRATPYNSLCYRYEQLSGSKKAMDCVTVLLCVNMSGSDKKKLLIIGKSKIPRCFKGINMETLPVIYWANSNTAWMRSVIFQQWITDWDVALIRGNRKILLLVDNCPAHPKIHPANTTSLIQSLDQGVIKNLKTFYRKELVQIIISAVDDNLVDGSVTAIDISSKISLLDAIYFLARSWRLVKHETITNCFHKSGFGTLAESV